MLISHNINLASVVNRARLVNYRTTLRRNVSLVFCDLKGIELQRGFIKVDEYQNTSAANIYALGDVCGKALLTPGQSLDWLSFPFIPQLLHYMMPWLPCPGPLDSSTAGLVAEEQGMIIFCMFHLGHDSFTLSSKIQKDLPLFIQID